MYSCSFSPLGLNICHEKAVIVFHSRGKWISNSSVYTVLMNARKRSVTPLVLGSGYGEMDFV